MQSDPYKTAEVSSSEVQACEAIGLAQRLYSSSTVAVATLMPSITPVVEQRLQVIATSPVTKSSCCHCCLCHILAVITHFYTDAPHCHAMHILNALSWYAGSRQQLAV